MTGIDASSLISLLVIFGVLIAANIAVRRWRGRLPGRTGGGIELIGSRPLGGQNSLLLVDVQGTRFLVGTNRTGVSTICRLPQRDTP
jgi:flagellar biogenesis protein FliO